MEVLCRVVANLLHWDTVEIEFEFVTRYHTYFWTNTLPKDNNLQVSSYMLSIATTVLLQGWLWY